MLNTFLPQGIPKAGYVSLASSFPSGIATGTLFWHSPAGRKILYMYDGSDWISLCSAGTTTLYVDGTDGTDDLTYGHGVGTNAFKTLGYALGMLPSILDDIATIYLSDDIFDENIDLHRVIGADIYIYGTMTTLATLTATGGAKGSGATPNAVNGTFLANQYDGKLIKFTSGTNNGTYRIIGLTTITKLYLVGNTLAAAPQTGDTYVVLDWATTMKDGRFLNLKNQLFIYDMKLSFTSSGNLYCQNSKVNLMRSWVSNASTTNNGAVDVDGGGFLGVFWCYFSNDSGGANHLIRSEYSGHADIEESKFNGGGTGTSCIAVSTCGSANTEANECSGALFGMLASQNGSISEGGNSTVNSFLHGNTNGVYANKVSNIEVNSKITYGVLLDGTADINTADETEVAATFGNITS